MTKKKISKVYSNLFYYVWSFIDPVPWVIEKKAKTILDLGCGQGNPMKLIKNRMHIDYSVGIDLFEPYLKIARREKIFNKIVKADLRKINIKDRSFDVVLLDQIIEHLYKKDAWNLIKKAEKIAKMQIIVATPIGPCYQPEYDGNKLQIHKSFYFPEEFEKRGYKIVKYGWKYLLDEHSFGLIHKTQNPIMKRTLYYFNVLLTPIYYTFQSTCDYIFVAYKSVNN